MPTAEPATVVETGVPRRRGTNARSILRFAGKRLLIIPVSLFVVITVAFGLVNILPGDIATQVAGGFVTPERLAEIRADLRLDDPLWERYVDYLAGLFRGDLGTSFYTGEPVRTEIAHRLPSTLELVAVALALAVLIGMTLGTVAAYFRRRAPERVARVLVSLGQATPDFLLGLVLIYLLFFVAGVAPAPVGRFEIIESAPDRVTGFYIVDAAIGGDWELLGSLLRHLMLPAITLGVVYAAYFAKISRTALATALDSKQVEFARGCGLSEFTVYRYALLTARTPIITYGAIILGGLLSGAAIVETIFSWQGLGMWGLDSLRALDLPAIQGFILVAGIMTMLVYVALDIVVMVLDPRVRYE